MINLIPYNSTSVAAAYRAPSRADSERFQRILTDEYRLFTTVRVEMGADIEGACGQLALENQHLQVKPRGLMDDTATADLSGMTDDDTREDKQKNKSLDIEDLGRAGKPAQKKNARAVVKKRTAVAPSSSSSSSSCSSSAAASAGSAAAAAADGCCASDPSKSCDCSSAPSGGGESASPTADEIAAIEQKDEDEVTVGELLKLVGVKSHVEVHRDSSLPAVPIPVHSSPYLTDADKYLLAKQREARSWQQTDKFVQIAIGAAALAAGILFLYVKDL